MPDVFPLPNLTALRHWSILLILQTIPPRLSGYLISNWELQAFNTQNKTKKLKKSYNRMSASMVTEQNRLPMIYT